MAGALNDQMAAFPDGEHDDILDAMAMADDVKVDRLVHTFNVQNNVVEPMKIPCQLAKMGKVWRQGLTVKW